ncbi:MAG: ATP-binding protein, partial [Bacteroidota bacterium]
MNDLEQWQRNNEEYLARALTWLRLRLAQESRMPPPPPIIVKKRSWWQKFCSPFSQHKSPGSTLPSSEPIGHHQMSKEASKAAEAMVEAEKAEPSPALILLGRRFGLSRFELYTLLLCAAMELDTRIAQLCAQAQGNANQAYPTFALALSLFDEPAWDALSPERPLRYWQLIEINQPGAQPLTTSALKADERIVNYIKGLNYLDDRLAPLLVPLDVAGSANELPPSQQKAVDKVAYY